LDNSKGGGPEKLNAFRQKKLKGKAGVKDGRNKIYEPPREQGQVSSLVKKGLFGVWAGIKRKSGESRKQKENQRRAMRFCNPEEEKQTFKKAIIWGD